MRKRLLTALILSLSTTHSLSAETYRWIEAERPIVTNFPPNPFAPKDAGEKSKLSGGGWIGAAGKRPATLFAVYDVDVPEAGDYRFFVRKFWKHGPYRVQFNNGAWVDMNGDVPLLDEVELRPTIVANWTSAGSVKLNAGRNRFRIESTTNDGPIAFDCFLLTNGNFTPRGTTKPDEALKSDEPGWFAWDPAGDKQNSPIDLRFLNEPFAGSDGPIVAREGRFVHEKTGKPVRFWGVNCSPDIARLGDDDLDRLATMLASRGVNLVRWHGPVYAQNGPTLGTIDMKQIANLQRAIRIFKRRGIYATLSIYYRSWLELDASNGWPGYKKQTPYGLLFFDAKFQAMYRDWWKALLTTPDAGGIALKDEPAVLSLELLNEDSLFFWTFVPRKSIPVPASEAIEKQFGDWLTKRDGSIENAMAKWGKTAKLDGDSPAEGRVGVLAAGDIAGQRETQRAKDTAAFLYETEHNFFAATRSFLRDEIGTQALVSGGNWTTASDQYLTPLERAANLAGDFIDRHGYYGPKTEGPKAAYSVDAGERFSDRSALRFDPEAPGGKINTWNPTLDTSFNDKPTMVSEFGWPEPNRFTAEAPLLAAAMGAQQDTDAIDFFAVAAPSWQPTITRYGLTTPTMLAQSPAAALIYRLGLVDEAAATVETSVSLTDLLDLRGTPRTGDFKSRYAGKTHTAITESPSQAAAGSTSADDSKVVTSSTSQLTLDYGHGVLRLDSPRVKAVVGFLAAGGDAALAGVTLRSPMEYGAIAVVPLDGEPIATSKRLLVQAMSEQHNAGWKTDGDPIKTISSFGHAPILVRELAGTITFTDGAKWVAQPLDQNDQPLGTALPASNVLELKPTIIHYVLTRSPS